MNDGLGGNIYTEVNSINDESIRVQRVYIKIYSEDSSGYYMKVQGKTYKLKYRELNTIWWLDHSPESAALIADFPSRPPPVELVDATLR